MSSEFHIDSKTDESWQLSDHRLLVTDIQYKAALISPARRFKKVNHLKKNISTQELDSIFLNPLWPDVPFNKIYVRMGLSKTSYEPVNESVTLKRLVRKQL